MPSDAVKLNKLVEKMAGKPFVLIGVNCDKDMARAKAMVADCQITWPSFWDGRDGPIATLWNVDSWLNTWVLDRQGFIRYRDVRERELENAVDTLLRE